MVSPERSTWGKTTIATGSGSSGTGEVRSATLTVTRLPRDERIRTQMEFEAAARQSLSTIPGVRLTFGTGEHGEKLTIVLAGNDAALLQGTAEQVERDLRSIPGLGDVRSSAAYRLAVSRNLLLRFLSEPR